MSTSERLAEAAQQLISEEGWGAVTTRRVAERAGVNPGVVHYHVGSIDALRRGAVLTAVEAFFARIGAVQQSGSTADDLRAVFAAMAGVAPDDPALAILYESLVAARRDEQLRQSLARLISDFRAQLVARLSAEGNSDPVATATMAAAAIDGFLLQRMLDRSVDEGALLRGLDRIART